MLFCINCGQHLPNEANYCFKCGTNINNANKHNQRKTVYEGGINKCPNCGETLSSFTANCPRCSYEIRDALNSDAVRRFETKLNSLNNQQERIRFIKSYPIPNTKEDIYEFFILASSNIDESRYGLGSMFNKNTSDFQRELSDAWLSKLEQSYNKAVISFGNTSEFKKFESMYKEKKSLLKKEKDNIMLLIKMFFAILLLLVLIIAYNIIYSNYQRKTTENELKQTLKQVEEYISQGDYENAQIMAKQLIPSDYLTYSTYENWNNIRDSYLKEIDIKKELSQGKIMLSLTRDDSFADYEIVEEKLCQQGFCNVVTTKVEDLSSNLFDASSEGKVSEITVNGKTCLDRSVFQDINIYTYPSAEIVIYYHTFKEKN